MIHCIAASLLSGLLSLHYTEDLVLDMRSLLFCLISNMGNLLLCLIPNIRDFSLDLSLDLSPRRLYLVQSSLGDFFGFLLHFLPYLLRHAMQPGG
ncbi:hypothetical protein C8R41DRAFT_832323 [Lentinula lateritia]|uniref:Uncharacterized protein n=1 Tax=Lentinula lateritia TaxID=40482 RepID=A0ABQ8VFK2_9AGAR|nr:hypothetical protein C8R41DRAFT_832323 [Lentinula lateritia]